MKVLAAGRQVLESKDVEEEKEEDDLPCLRRDRKKQEYEEEMKERDVGISPTSMGALS